MTYTSKSSILPCHGNHIECDKHLKISRDDAEKTLQAIIRGPDNAYIKHRQYSGGQISYPPIC
jgi:hypothetical protein